MTVQSGSIDEVGFEVQPAGPEAGGGFEVQIFVNGVELTSKGAGMGMDPYDVIVPKNRFLPQDAPHELPAARCGCGVYGCGVTDLYVTPDPSTGRIEWEWRVERPMRDRPVFDWTQYVDACERLSADTSWETPDRTVGRLVLRDPRLATLAEHGLAISWLGDRYDDTDYFEVCLALDDTHQIFVTFAWEDRDPHRAC